MSYQTQTHKIQAQKGTRHSNQKWKEREHKNRRRKKKHTELAQKMTNYTNKVDLYVPVRGSFISFILS